MCLMLFITCNVVGLILRKPLSFFFSLKKVFGKTEKEFYENN